MVDITASLLKREWRSIPIVIGLIMVISIAMVTMTNGTRRYQDDFSLPTKIVSMLQEHEEEMKANIESKVKEWVGSTKVISDDDEIFNKEGEMVTTETLKPDPVFLASTKYKKMEK